MVIRSAGAWFYFNAEYIRQQIVGLIDNAPIGLRMVVVDCSIVPAIDPSAGATLRALAKALSARHIKLVLAELHDDVVENLKALDAETDLGPITAHRTIEDCLKPAP
jgi:MFS superfamily sulfate permease-like transporter